MTSLRALLPDAKDWNPKEKHQVKMRINDKDVWALTNSLEKHVICFRTYFLAFVADNSIFGISANSPALLSFGHCFSAECVTSLRSPYSAVLALGVG